MNRLAFLLVLVAACGDVTLAARDAGTELEAHDAGAGALEAGRDACAPATLFCTGLHSLCPDGQTVANETVCGGRTFAVCCPANVCELEACAPCADCVP